jgi:hypothetical protein
MVTNRLLTLCVSAYALAVATAQAQPALADRFVCDTNRHHVVIDQDVDGSPRYRAWNKPHPLNQKPDVEIRRGTEETAGTDPCVNTTWTFKRGTVEYSVSDSAACTDGKPPPAASGFIVVEIDSQFADRYWCVK